MKDVHSHQQSPLTFVCVSVGLAASGSSRLCPLQMQNAAQDSEWKLASRWRLNDDDRLYVRY